MIFDLSEDHIMMRKMVRDFAEKEITPFIEKNGKGGIST